MSLETLITAIRSELVTMNDVADALEALGSFTSYTPTLSASGSMTYTSTTINLAQYLKIFDWGIVKFNITGTTGGTASTDLRLTLPAGWSWADTQNAQPLGTLTDSTKQPAKFLPSSGVIIARNMTDANWGLGSGRQFDGAVIARLA